MLNQSHLFLLMLGTFSASSSFHDPIIKSAGSFLIPVAFTFAEPFMVVPVQPLIETFTSDCSFKNVGEGSCPPEI